MRTFFLIIGSMLLWACSDRDKMPEGILSKEKITAIFIEKQIAEAKLEEAKLDMDTALIVYDHYMKVILEEQGISSENYRASIEYYRENTKELESIYDRVMDSLNLRHKKAEISDGAEESENPEKSEELLL